MNTILMKFMSTRFRVFMIVFKINRMVELSPMEITCD